MKRITYKDFKFNDESLNAEIQIENYESLFNQYIDNIAKLIPKPDISYAKRLFINALIYTLEDAIKHNVNTIDVGKGQKDKIERPFTTLHFAKKHVLIKVA